MPPPVDFLAVNACFPLVLPSSDHLGQLVDRKLDSCFAAACCINQLLFRAPLERRNRLLEADVKLIPYLEPPLRGDYSSRGMPGWLFDMNRERYAVDNEGGKRRGGRKCMISAIC